MMIRRAEKTFSCLITTKKMPNPMMQGKIKSDSLQLLVEIYKKSDTPEKAAEYEAEYRAATQPTPAPTTFPIPDSRN